MMGLIVAEKLIAASLVDGEMKKGNRIGIQITQTLTHDVTGVMSYLEFEAIGLKGWRQAINGFDTFEVAGKTVGIIGAGNIGRKVARRLKAFEADIIYFDPFAAADIEAELGARKVPLAELVTTADIISMHAPLLKDTVGLVGKREFLLMKPTAVIINTCRAELVDQEAFVEALQSKKFAGAGLDVFYQKPVLADDPFLKLENVIVSPHTAGHTGEGWNRRISFAWENIQRVAAGQNPVSVARID